MKILLVGGGGREHALAWRLAQSPSVSEIICAPGNPGMAEAARLAPVQATDVEALTKLAVDEKVALVVVGPEAPLTLGLADKLAALNIPVFGPMQAAARVEASKAFTKDLCAAANVPTAASQTFTEAAPAKAFLDGLTPPYVIKADGLAAGKGVIIAETRDEAETAIDEMLSGKFGAASAKLVIEEFLEGEEASLFALCDGKNAIAFGGAQDHKRVGDGDQGPNTGGMGAYSPAPILDQAMTDRVMAEIVQPSLRALSDVHAPYRGVLFAGLMIGQQGPKLIEYNARFGDPECQVLMMRLQSDLALILLAAANGDLANAPAIEFDLRPAVTVVLAAKGYPDTPKAGGAINGLDKANAIEGVKVFHAGTSLKDSQLVASGGRVLNVTAIGDDLRQAVDRAYQAVDLIDFADGFCRRDIAWRAFNR
ncbi:MAG: phosphoribosylamine--glycine ligase [Caulobacterales bacterium]